MMIAGTASAVRAQTAMLAWDPNTEPDIAGYRIYYGTQSGNYTQSIDVGNTTAYQIGGLEPSFDYFFAVQAYSGLGIQSPLSAEVSLPAAAPATTITSFVSSAGYPLLFGQPVTWTAAATSTRGPVEYKFLLYGAQTGWKVVQGYSQNPTFTWRPNWTDIGAHALQVWVRAVGSTALYEAWSGTDNFDVAASAVQLTADVDFPTPPGNTIRWNATVAGASGVSLEYKFLLLNRGSGAWSILRDYATSNQVAWTPTSVGSYAIQVWVRQVGSTALYEVWGGVESAVVSRGPLSVTALTSDAAQPAKTGNTITWTARARGGSAGPLQYQFVRFSAKSGWTVVKPYSSSNTYSWTPSWTDDDQYAIQVWVKNAGSTAYFDAWAGTDLFEVQRAPLQLALGTLFPAPPGTPVTVTATVADPTAAFEYQFFVYSQSTGTWSVGRSYSTSNTWTWTPAAVGHYVIQVWARRVGSTAGYDAWAGTNYLNVSVGPAQMVAIDANVELPSRVGTPITWEAKANGGTAAPLQYTFFLYTEGGGWTVLSDWSAQNKVTWTPSSADLGRHLVQVWVRSAGSTAAFESWRNTPYFAIYP